MMTEMVGRDEGARFDAAVIDELLREALIARAQRFGFDPATIASPGPGALIARTPDGTLLRLDVSTYDASDLKR